jgi:hypothetical protein
MVKDIVVIGDLGAGTNLIRNLLLLSSDTEWPLPNNRFNTIIQQYQPNTKLKDWLAIEDRLRFWKRYYGVDLSNHIDLMLFNQRQRTDKPVVYINHSAFYQLQEYQLLVPEVDILYVAPCTEFGLAWQIRSYCEKKTVEKLHNFTFEKDAEQQKTAYCLAHDLKAYYKLNVENFKSIVGQRQKEFGSPNITIEQLLFDPATSLVELLESIINVKIDVNQAQQILTVWRNLHWPADQTMNWEYYD